MNFTNIVHSVLHLGNGTGAFKKLIATYREELNSFGHRPIEHPVILLIDNDDGARDVFSTVKGNDGPVISLASEERFYYLFRNLYIVKTPEKDDTGKSCIENFFDAKLFETVIDGKTFDPRKKHGAADKYSKSVFAERVIRPRSEKIDFTGFSGLLDRIAAVLRDYKTRT